MQPVQSVRKFAIVGQNEKIDVSNQNPLQPPLVLYMDGAEHAIMKSNIEPHSEVDCDNKCQGYLHHLQSRHGPAGTIRC